MQPVIKKVYAPSTRGTLGVILPKRFADALELQKNTQIQIDLEEDAIVIRKAPVLPPRNNKEPHKK